MKNTKKQDDQSGVKIRDLFNEILGRHMERLLGTRYGIEELSLNLGTISCLILLVDRENEMEADSSSSDERYDEDGLLNELEELGLEVDESIEQAIKEMIKKGYAEVDDKGMLFPKKPTFSMVQLIDKAFPNMPGLNLVAYFIQIIDEMESGRKGIDAGVNLFDQTLRSQGVSIKKERSRLKGNKISKAGVTETSASPDPQTPSKSFRRIDMLEGMKLSDFYSPQKEKKAPKPTKTDSAEGDVVPPQGERLEQHDIKDENLDTLAAGGEDVLESSPSTPASSEAPESEEPAETEAATSVHDLSTETPEEDHDITAPTEEPPPTEDPVAPVKASDPELDSEAPEDDHTETTPESESQSLDDAQIEEQIAAFEAGLSMKCPLCDGGEVHNKETAKGKFYFLCSNKNCHFISWGQPYHIECPQCKNPFLIESTDKSGKVLLKCPRATCRYRQDLAIDHQSAMPKNELSSDRGKGKSKVIMRRPKKMVRRRRVVRRKR